MVRPSSHDVLMNERDHHNPKEVSDGKTTKQAQIHEVKHYNKYNQKTTKKYQNNQLT